MASGDEVSLLIVPLPEAPARQIGSPRPISAAPSFQFLLLDLAKMSKKEQSLLLSC
jgi:hypothetical protein